MQDLNIEHCEEPMPTWNRRDQSRLVAESPIPIMADESVFHHHDAFQILADGAADMLNIKLGKSGGIANAMKIGAIAESADVYCQVGSFSETRLGITALVHFAHAWKNIVHYDLDSPLMLSEDPVIGGMKYEDDWTVTLDDAHGHGATFDDQFLNKFERIIVQ
jgi:L-alanine-DL-glutamate epimerase-like enolase superfamily enzyme